MCPQVSLFKVVHLLADHFLQPAHTLSLFPFQKQWYTGINLVTFTRYDIDS